MTLTDKFWGQFELDLQEVKLAYLNCVLDYKNFFAVAFYTGMRFGEMAAIKWKNLIPI